MERRTLAEVRRDNGITVERLARKINRPLSTVSNWMCLRTVPSVTEAIRVCDALGCTVYDVIWEKDSDSDS